MDNWSRQVIFSALVITIGGGLSGVSSMIPTAVPTAANYQATTAPEKKTTMVVSAKRSGASKSAVKVKAASKSVALRLFTASSDKANVRTYAMN